MVAYLAVETECDLDCLSCHCPPREERGERPTRETIRDRLKRGRFLGSRELVLGGGEPTLREDLERIVEEAKGLGYERITLATNAHGLARPRRAESLAGAGVGGLLVDLHGPIAAVHDGVAGTDKAFAWTIAGLRGAQRAGIARFDALVAVTRRNLEALAETARLALRLGASAVHVVLPGAGSQAAIRGEIARWDLLRPRLVEATSGASRGKVDVQGAPLCALPEAPGTLRPLPPWELARVRPQRARTAACEGCVEFLLCGGFFEPGLARLYGMDELSERLSR